MTMTFEQPEKQPSIENKNFTNQGGSASHDRFSDEAWSGGKGSKGGKDSGGAAATESEHSSADGAKKDPGLSETDRIGKKKEEENNDADNIRKKKKDNMDERDDDAMRRKKKELGESDDDAMRRKKKELGGGGSLEVTPLPELQITPKAPVPYVLPADRTH